MNGYIYNSLDPVSKKVNKDIKRGFPDKIRKGKPKKKRVFAPGKKSKKH